MLVKKTLNTWSIQIRGKTSMEPPVFTYTNYGFPYHFYRWSGPLLFYCPTFEQKGHVDFRDHQTIQ